MANSMLRDLHHYTGRQKSPTLVLLHGFRSNEEDLFSLGNDIDHRFNVFSLRGKRKKQRFQCLKMHYFLDSEIETNT